jgi:hypothetical protein
MKITYDTDAILLQILRASDLTGNLTGGVYAGDRPDNSAVEDVTINTLPLSQDFLPQVGTSNVNIHVPDLYVTIGGVKQKKENRARLGTLTGIALQAIRETAVPGLSLTVSSQTTIVEVDISQHYVNIRIDWSIH